MKKTLTTLNDVYSAHVRHIMRTRNDTFYGQNSATRATKAAQITR